MITRIWHGRTSTANATAYRELVIASGIKDYKNTKGNQGAQIWQQQEGDVTHIWTVSWWDTMESIRAFAGDDVTRARYYPEDDAYLLEKEPLVQHYDCWKF